MNGKLVNGRSEVLSPAMDGPVRTVHPKWKFGALIRLDRARMSGARGLFQCLRQARLHHGLWRFYLRHRLWAEAQDERARMMGHLRGARQQWRLTLGIGP